MTTHSSLELRNELCIGDPDIFAGDMVKLINAREYSDIGFLVGEERQVICGHRCLLSARCEVFRAMFAVQKEEEHSAPLVLTDIKPKIFLAVLEYIYTNCCSLNTELVIDILAASIEYGLDGLTKICVRFMRDNILIDTVCEYIQAAFTYNQTTLHEECLSFIEENTAEVFSSSGFNELSDDTLASILLSDRLQMDEGDIFDKVLEWATINSVVTGSLIGEVALKVINNIRFPLLDPDKLSQIENDNKKTPFVPMTLIAGAWKYHALKKVDPRNSQTCPRAGTLPRESLRALGLGHR